MSQSQTDFSLSAAGSVVEETEASVCVCVPAPREAGGPVSRGQFPPGTPLNDSSDLLPLLGGRHAFQQVATRGQGSFEATRCQYVTLSHTGSNGKLTPGQGHGWNVG